MESLYGGYTLKIYDGCFPLSTDSMVLAHFARLPKAARVLDLGSGCGTLGLLLCAQRDDCHITGLELNEKAHLGALENIARNGLEARMQSIHCDLRDAPVEAGRFDVCISNPPYFTGGPAAKLTNARRDDTCAAKDLLIHCRQVGIIRAIAHTDMARSEICALGSFDRLNKILTHLKTAGMNTSANSRFDITCAKLTHCLPTNQ
jgi:tRNA1(Val) A37 N6-methylase TrmN6